MSVSGLAAHLSPAELGQRYRAAGDAIERSHLQIVWLLSRGHGEHEVAQVTGYGRRWIAEIVRRYNEGGPEGLGDRRRANAGAEPLMSVEAEAALRAVLAEPPPDGGLWTGPKVAAWMGGRLGREVWPQRGWDYLYGFVHPSTGEVVWFICSTVDAGLLSAVLAAFAAAVGAGEGKRIILVLDNAGWHVSGDLVVPPGVEPAFLPPYTPELQPAEHLWPLTNEAVANKHFATLKDLDAALSERCRTLAAMPETIKAATNFGWWPAATPVSPL